MLNPAHQYFKLRYLGAPAVLKSLLCQLSFEDVRTHSSFPMPLVSSLSHTLLELMQQVVLIPPCRKHLQLV
ncbi:hypothetical protein AgCh_030464 [Apium graveolens]